jgi:hypothetical protein
MWLQTYLEYASWHMPGVTLVEVESGVTIYYLAEGGHNMTWSAPQLDYRWHKPNWKSVVQKSGV